MVYSVCRASCCALAIAMSFAVSNAIAADPLHVRIDQLVDKTAIGPRAEIADDLTFLRRVYLDLIGRVPVPKEARAFLAETSPDKRAAVVDQLLASDAFPRHMATVFDVMLMERRNGKHVKTPELRTWLRKAFQENRPYIETATALLAADGSPGDNRAAAAFYLERDVEPNLLTREISRMFFGMDVQCAQCHDHPLIDDYLQTDYYGVFAFVNRLSLFRPDAKKPGLLMEGASGDAGFKSVFTDREAYTGPRLPGGTEITEPAFAPGDEYKVKPGKNVRHVPKYSRREKLVELVASAGNKAFDTNIVNRLWALLMGRGLVHPVDHHHSENPPTDPELLDLLATEFSATKYDIRAMLREIALSSVYQRSYQLPVDLAPSVDAAKKTIPELQAAVAVAGKSGEAADAKAGEVLTQLDAALAEAKPIRAALGKARSAAAEAAKKRDAAEKALKDKQNALAAKQPIANAVRLAFEKADAAAKAITDDKELAAATATLKKKSDALAAETKKLSEEGEKLKKPAADTQAALVEAQKPVQAELAKLAPAEEKIRTRRAEFLSAQNEIRKSREQIAYTNRRIEFLETLVNYAEAEQQLAQITPALPAAEVAATTTQKTLAEATTKMQAADAALVKSKAAMEAAAKALAETTTLFNSRRQGSQLTDQTLVKANEALQKLPADPELKQAVATLTSSSTRLKQEAAEAEKLVATRTTAAASAKSEFDQTNVRQQQAKQILDQAKPAADQAAAKLASMKAGLAKFEPQLNESSEKVIQLASAQFNIAVLEPLGPEQLGWSMLHVTGRFEQQRAAQRAKLTKEKPLSEADQKDPAKIAAREKEIEEAAFTAIEPTVAKFVGLFGGQKGQPQDAFFATVDQALFVSNAGDLISWLNPSGENLTGRLIKLEDSKALAEELYMSIFTRRPTEEEFASVAEYLTNRKEDRNAAITELAWALITSVEFRFHH